MDKWVYSFQEGSAADRELLGGKGANLAEMTAIGLPVPPGFIISTEACNAYLANPEAVPDVLWDQVQASVTSLESQLGREFGGQSNPLLLSVRSGASVSMPGMMDTVLNLGLIDDSVPALAESSDRRFALDCYRRLIQMFAEVVDGVPASHFENALDDIRRQSGKINDNEIPAEALSQLVSEYKSIYRKETGTDFPQDPIKQLHRAVIAVFDSWNTRRAKHYRETHRIPEHLGTAANVQAMVFGNMGDDCATGVAFTRNPSTGAHGLFGEFLINAQGEDVVAGIRTPLPIDQMVGIKALEDAAAGLGDAAHILEHHYRDMQDLEFTVQNGTLYILQTRTGKRTGVAAVNIAVDMVTEGLIDQREAVRRVEPEQLDQLLHPTIDASFVPDQLAIGLPASPGAASGKIVFDADEAKLRGDSGEDVILVRIETSPDDFHGMVAARGVLTARGGMTSHAAVVARGMGIPCVAGCAALEIDYSDGIVVVNGRVLSEGHLITIDGATGQVFDGAALMIESDLHGSVETLLEWADMYRTLDIRTNADTPAETAQALQFGAEGIGLCRTEHMFFGDERLQLMRAMIMASTTTERRNALLPLQELQTRDFTEIFAELHGRPVTIRTLDPPLHEFLPHSDDEILNLAGSMGLSVSEVEAKTSALKEVNPMLGHRGCRLGIVFPEITEMQALAMFNAASDCISRGIPVQLEIMIPLVSDVSELHIQKDLVLAVAERVRRERGVEFEFSVGTMIELPRAALLANEIASEAEFFSFGTNDLTQMTYGMSRDDAGRFLPLYTSEGIFARDPFISLDQSGVGELIEIAVKRGRQTRPELKLGICGEHGGDPDSVAFCHCAGLDYVSCSPYRVPIARLAAAQAALETPK